MQAELEGTSCQLSCPGTNTPRDCEPSKCLVLISILFQHSIRLQYSISFQVLLIAHETLPKSMQVPVSPPGSGLTFSVVMSVSASCRFCVKMMLNTA